MKRLTLFALAALLGTTLISRADDDDKAEKSDAAVKPGVLPPVATNAVVTYAADIKPILDASCVDCHTGSKAKDRLHLDSLAGVLKGSKEGKIVKPGDSANSLLVRSTAHLSKDRESWMPPLHNKDGIKPLLPEEISLIRAWIDQGAK
jgi:hypothetical protein